jgi:CDP-glycerol glycerophosphotransferase
MASLSLINRVKYSSFLYNAYFHIGSIGVRLMRLFVRKDKSLIVFSSFGGRKYDDSPKCIYEEMLRDHRFDKYRIVWAFMNPDAHDIPRGDKVKLDTWAYYKTLLKARVWITNSTMERGLSFKGDSIFYYNSWHGTPIKLMGGDIREGNQSFGTKEKRCPYDVFCAQSEYDSDIFKRSFHVPDRAMKIIGLPRNDELINNAGEERKNRIKAQLGIPNDKRVILYAPTFREYSKDENLNCVIAPPIHLKRWKESLGHKFVLIFRAHYEVVKVMNVVSDEFVKDVSAYPSLNDLMIVSDVLISDYSSMFFDYSVMRKPMLCFAYDYDKYAKERGMYFDIREWLPNADNEDDLIKLIRDTDTTKECVATKKFQENFVTEYGSASKKSLDIIYDAIK